MTLAPGTRLGPYEILAPLGAGGMGEVYRARDTRLGRDVAVKVLAEHLSSEPEVRARFEREARAVSSLNHPHICTLHDVGREGDTDYLVMELVDGETLAQRLERGALPTSEVLRLGAQIADALDRAHRAGIVHRDLKPANVMLTKSGAKLMDFGLARASGGMGAGSGTSVTLAALSQSPTMSRPLTVEGTIVGTFQYMSPEQLEAKEADARSDLWALGCVLYEMATGKRAFEGKSQASLISSIMKDAPRPMTEMAPASPVALERLVGALLSKDAGDRIQTAHDVRLQLEWAEPEATGTGRATPGRGRESRRLPRLALALTLIATLAAAFLAGRAIAPRHDLAQVLYQRKTFRTQAIFTARFMPGGQTAVVSAAIEGNVPEIFVIRPENPEPQPLGLRDVHLLGVSSRGELAVLTGARYTGHHRLFTGTLARMPLEGAAPREVHENVREADWAPGGDDFAIIHEVSGKDRLEFPIGKVLYESAGYLSDPRVSPDGDRVAFMEHPEKWDDRGSVNVVDLEGKARVLTAGFWGEEGLAWSPDGKEVYFSATYSGGGYDPFAVDLSGRLRRVLQSAGGLTLHDIAPDGRWIATQENARSGIAVRLAGDAAESDLSWLNSSLNPRLSADAGTLLFTDQDQAAGPNYTVCVRPTRGGPIVRLGEGAGNCFSPDGKSVLAIVASTPPRLMSHPIGAGQAVRLDHGEFENISDAYWLFDGKRMLVSGNEPGRPPRCYLLDASSGALAPAGPEGISRGIPAPDGSRFVARDQAGWSLFPLAAGVQTQSVGALSPTDDVIRWSPDGTALFTYGIAEVPARVARIDLRTGVRDPFMELIPENRAALLSVLSVSIADDLRSCAYAWWRYESILYVVEGAR